MNPTDEMDIGGQMGQNALAAIEAVGHDDEDAARQRVGDNPNEFEA